MDDSYGDKFIKIAFTLPGSEHPTNQEIHKESEKIVEALHSEKFDLVHLRKPKWTRSQLEELISCIPEKYHPKLKIHDHFSLLNRYNLGGVHLNKRNPVPPANARSVSKSLHTIEELVSTCGTCFDYVTLSPIYDSISKPGYQSAFPEELTILTPLLKGNKVVALGGITKEKIPVLKNAGFSGYAMMGAAWKHES